MMYLNPPYSTHTRTHTHRHARLTETAGTTACNALMRFVVWRWCDFLHIMCWELNQQFLHCDPSKAEKNKQLFRMEGRTMCVFLMHLWLS